MRADGTSASPMPPELGKILFCQRVGWNLEDYINAPTDEIKRWRYILGHFDDRVAELREESRGGGSDYVRFDDGD